jgi:tetratricopeptide (TPR) repeat protein
MLVGHPRAGHGTAWVLSKKHRLLVTNAHVADICHEAGGKMFAIPSGSSTAYKVEKVWYHPGLRRFMKDNKGVSVRAMNPTDGDVDCRSPDLAVLQLSSYGPELPIEFPMATPDELTDLFGQPVAKYGFPGHDTEGFPAIGENATGTFHTGVVSRITDFHYSTAVPHGELQFLQYTISSFPGFSGSPVFLPNGHVAAINNCGRTRQSKGTTVTITHGIRVDALWELLVYHGLDSKVSAKIDKDKLLLSRYRERDERDERTRANLDKARALCEEAAYMIDVREDFRGGADKCIQAIRLAPGFAPAHRGRSVALTNYWVMMSEHMSKKDAADTLVGALKHATTYAQLVPSDPRATILVCLSRINLAIVTGEKSEAKNALTILDELMNAESLSTEARAEAHSAKGTAYCCLEDYDAALGHHNEAVRLDPEGAVFWSNRGNFWSNIGRHDLAAQDHAKANELREKEMKK